MGKKILLPAVLVLFAVFALGGALLYGHQADKWKATGGASIRSNEEAPGDKTGDPGRAVVPQNPPADTKSGETSTPQNPPADTGSGNTSTPQNLPPAAKRGTADTGETPATQSASRSGDKDTGAGRQSSSGDRDALRSRIEQEYTGRLQSLASGYEAKLSGLVSAAAKEYKQAKKDDPNADITNLVNNYYAAGKALEAECDAQFYSLLAAFEGELKANSFPLDAAAKAKATYEARKSSRAGELLSGKP